MTVKDELLDKCLNEIQSGFHSATQCAEQHPEVAEELLPMLLAAERCLEAPAVAPSADFRSNSHTRMLNMLDAQAAPPAKKLARLPRLSLHLPPSFARYAVAVILVIVLVTGGTGAAAQSAPPNSPFYGAKLALEDLRATTAMNDAQRAAIYLDFADRRLKEIQALEGSDDAAAALVMNRYRENIRLAVEAAIGSNEPERVCTEADLRLAEQQKQLERDYQGGNGSPAAVDQSLGALQRERSSLQSHMEGHGGSGSGGGNHGNPPSPTIQPSATENHSGTPSAGPSPHGWVHTDPETWRREHHSDSPGEMTSPEGHPGPTYQGGDHAGPSNHNEYSNPSQTSAPMNGEHDDQMNAGEHKEPANSAPAPTVAPTTAPTIAPAPEPKPQPTSMATPMPQPAGPESGSGGGEMHGGDYGGHMEGGGH